MQIIFPNIIKWFICVMVAQWTLKYSVEFRVPIVISSFVFFFLFVCVRMHRSSLLLIPDVEFNYLNVADSSTYEIINSRILKT